MGNLIEFCDVINQDGSFKCSMPRAVVHERGYLHQAVRVFVFNPNVQIYIQERSKAKSVHPGLLEGSFAEHQIAGESALAAAVRGAKQELDLKLDPKKLSALGTYDTNNPLDNLRYTLLVTYDVEGTIKLSDESAWGEWEHPSDLDKLTRTHPSKFTPGFLQAWNLYRSFPRK